MNNDFVTQISNKIKSSDLTQKEIVAGGRSIHFIYLKSVIDKDLLTLGVFSPIVSYKEEIEDLETLQTKVLKVGETEIEKDFDKMVSAITENKVLLFLDNEKNCLTIDVEYVPARQPTEPPTSAVIKGPREGFTESLKTNVALLRKRLKTEKLVFENLSVGKYSNTQISLCYIDGIADKGIIKKITKRLKEINIDGIIDSYYILSFLEERPGSIFKQVGSSEKPDIVTAKILEGRVAILVDNSPIVLTLPFLFIEDMQNSNDYYTRAQFVTYIRLIRLFGVFVASILPGVYLALRLYHYNLMPLSFLITIISATQFVPFSPFIEILFTTILFRLLYEVSLRLPSYLGLATSIVGALILGDTGVKAGLISPPGVMIVALSIISTYIIPDQADQFNIIRLAILLLGGGIGIFGVVCGVVFIVGYMNSITSYGAPYLAPISPLVVNDLKDTLKMVDITKMKTRPKSFKNNNEVRQRNEKRD